MLRANKRVQRKTAQTRAMEKVVLDMKAPKARMIIRM